MILLCIKLKKNNEFAIIGLYVNDIISGTNEKFIKEISIELLKYIELRRKEVDEPYLNIMIKEKWG